MNAFPGPEPPTWKPSVACRVDRACVAFEAQLKQAVPTGQWPAAEAHLSESAEPERTALLRELLGLEIDYRRRAGEQPTPAIYLQRFPDHADLVRELFEAPPPPPPAPRSGQADPVIPGYERMEKLGAGGMGVVYRAWQIRPGRVVAVKMISPSSLGDPEELAARFLVEAEAIGRLNHPNIVQIYEMGDCEGRLYFSMEYVEGGGLDRHVAEAPWQPRAAAELLAALASALDAVHRQGIVHRDLKPANVLLAGLDLSVRDSREPMNQDSPLIPKITDFGLAKLLVGGQEKTESGAIIGTPSYMAPEQARGRARDVTPATDLYALGAILYVLLTGRPPFLGETQLEVLTRVVQEDPVPPSRLRVGVPRDLEVICLKCLEKEPRKRYASAAQLGERLRLFLDGKPIPDRPPGSWERLVRSARRHPVISGLLGVSVAAVLGVLLVALWYNIRLQEQVRQGVAREEVQKLLLEGRQARDEKNLEAAARAVDSAWGKVEADVSLAELRTQTRQLHDQIHRELAAQQARAASLAQYRAALRFYQDLPAPLLKARASAATANAGAAGLLARMDVAIRRAEALTQDPNLSEVQKKELTAGCHEVLLVLAHFLPPSAGAARQQVAAAVALLERAGRLGAPPRTYCERLAQWLTQLGRADRARGWAAKRPPTVAADSFLAGLDSYRQRDLERAAAYFADARRVQPGHFWALYCLAQSHLEAGRWPDAEGDFAECLKQRRDLPGPYLGHGFAVGKRKKAFGGKAVFEEDFAEALKLGLEKEDIYRLYVMRGTARFDAGQPAPAAEDFREATRLLPKAYAAHMGLGQVYRHQGRWDAAAVQFQMMIALTPPARDLADAHAELGRVWLLRARGQGGADRQALAHKAKANCERALALLPGHLAALRVRAQALMELRDYAAAEDSYSRYLELEREESALRDAYLGRGLARFRRGDYPGAVDDYTRARAPRSAPDPELCMHRGWAYYFTGAWELGQRDFEEALALSRREPAEGAGRVIGYLVPSTPGTSPWQAAAAFLTRQNGDAYNGRGNCLVMRGRYREAVADAETAYQRIPRSPEMMLNLACIFAQAAPQVKDDPKQPAREDLAKEYTARAVVRLRQALFLVGPTLRSEFWRTRVLTDPTLRPLHGVPDFERLAQEMNRKPVPPGERRR